MSQKLASALNLNLELYRTQIKGTRYCYVQPHSNSEILRDLSVIGTEHAFFLNSVLI